jgi:hypothetical protein
MAGAISVTTEQIAWDWINASSLYFIVWFMIVILMWDTSMGHRRLHQRQHRVERPSRPIRPEHLILALTGPRCECLILNGALVGMHAACMRTESGEFGDERRRRPACYRPARGGSSRFRNCGCSNPVSSVIGLLLGT